MSNLTDTSIHHMNTSGASNMMFRELRDNSPWVQEPLIPMETMDTMPDQQWNSQQYHHSYWLGHQSVCHFMYLILPCSTIHWHTIMELMACLPWVWNGHMILMVQEMFHMDGALGIPDSVPTDHKEGHRLVLEETPHGLTHRIIMDQNQLQTHGMGCHSRYILRDHHLLDQFQNGELSRINIGNHGKGAPIMTPGMEDHSLVRTSGHKKIGMLKSFGIR